MGKIAVFKTLVGAIRVAMPGVEPGSIHFRKMMTSMSKQLTVNIVRDWDLPSTIIEPLIQHITFKAIAVPS